MGIAVRTVQVTWEARWPAGIWPTGMGSGAAREPPVTWGVADRAGGRGRPARRSWWLRRTPPAHAMALALRLGEHKAVPDGRRSPLTVTLMRRRRPDHRLVSHGT